MDNLGQSVLRTAKAYLMVNVKYDDDQGDLFAIFNSSDLSIVDTGQFSQRIWNQTIHIGSMLIPISLFDVALDLEDEIREIISKVYPDNDERILSSFEIGPKLIESDDDYEEFINGYLEDLPTRSNAKFQKIEEEIIQTIRSAKYTIWVVSPWLSNRKLLNELAAKQRSGISVRIVLSNEESNQKFIPKIRDLFDAKVVDKWGVFNQNRVHEKFCIVDFNIVGHGSYNWSENANYNNETWVTSTGGSLIFQFADEFQKLYQKGR